MAKQLDLKTVNLPPEFAILLRSNLSQEKDMVDLIQSSFSANPIFKVIFGHISSFMSSNQDVKQIIKSLGWLHFRDRLASLYLNKLVFGRYPYEVDSEVINDILELETRLSSYSVQNVSRAYLLGFYIKIHNINHPTDLLVIPDSVFEVLKYNQHRMERIDYLIILLWHFVTFFGEKKVREMINEEQRSYEDFYEVMNDQQKDIMLRNLLHYGFSIDEHDIFEHEIL